MAGYTHNGLSSLIACTQCGEEQDSIEGFYWRTGGVRASECKECAKARANRQHQKDPERHRARSRQWAKDNPEAVRRAILKRHHITPEKFDAMLAAQGGGCAVCGTTTPGGRGNFSVDHDHACCSGKTSCGRCIRGLLCWNCNRAVGDIEANWDLLVEIPRYLGRHP